MRATAHRDVRQLAPGGWQLAQPSDVDTVVVDIRILRRKGAFTALDYGKMLAEPAQSVEALKVKAKRT
jgi:hypothetical protein